MAKAKANDAKLSSPSSSASSRDVAVQHNTLDSLFIITSDLLGVKSPRGAPSTLVGKPTHL
jgi:hypothetical protein